MGLETGTYISDLVATNPTASDPKAQGDDHIRLLKSTVKVTFPNVSGAVTPTHVELNYVDGVTSAIQTQLDGKLPLTGGTISGNLAVTGTLGVTGAFSGTTGAFSGAVTGVTATAGDSSTKFATTAYVQSTAFSSALPSQTGNSGKFVTTDGTSASWGLVPLTSGVSGTLPVANGGTGAATLTGLVKGNGTGAFTAAAAGTDYQAVLVSGTNIKTVNSNSLLGSGDLTISTSTLYLHVRDEKASGSDGGTFTGGAWQTRTLNTVKTNSIPSASVASSQITLPAGTYRIQARAPCLTVDAHKTRLQNITDTSTVAIGSVEYAASSTVTSASWLTATFTIAGTKVFELQHYSSGTGTTTGFGRAYSAPGVVEVYAEVLITKEA